MSFIFRFVRPFSLGSGVVVSSSGFWRIPGSSVFSLLFRCLVGLLLLHGDFTKDEENMTIFFERKLGYGEEKWRKKMVALYNGLTISL